MRNTLRFHRGQTRTVRFQETVFHLHYIPLFLTLSLSLSLWREWRAILSGCFLLLLLQADAHVLLRVHRTQLEDRETRLHSETENGVRLRSLCLRLPSLPDSRKRGEDPRWRHPLSPLRYRILSITLNLS